MPVGPTRLASDADIVVVSDVGDYILKQSRVEFRFITMCETNEEQAKTNMR